MRDFRKLQVWVKAHQLALNTYRVNGEYERLAGNVTEVKQMLTGLIQKLKNDG